ncbi:protein phosphatase 1H isoform X2 [Hydra vulgaris]|uniref:protein phosphatase 1H isoform X2 n=1 Tax=Hydra vulgaris TaxID=6087 RepID=UPI001F5EFA73|nr:protein phosphatase 1H isoform X2 [Hydra vulgaris]
MQFNSIRKFTTRAFSYLLEPQQQSSLAYNRYNLEVKYSYDRPEFLELDSEAKTASADHEIRPIICPKHPLVMKAGYAEVINGGKTENINEDQSCFHAFTVTVPVDQRAVDWTSDKYKINCILFGMFDGHADQLYVANAGDSRAIIFKNGIPIPMSSDHNPDSERRRIQSVAMLKPSLLGNIYTRYQFQHRCHKKDIGTKQLFRDYNMEGWHLKTIDKHDIKPQIICGEGKYSRLLDTIGTTRGFGDHDLEVPYSVGVKIKPFMLAAPDVKVFQLSGSDLNEDDVLVISTDGLWEKLTIENVNEILKNKLSNQEPSDPRRYIVAAQSLVDEARGSFTEHGWRTIDNKNGSYDDISVFVIPLANWKADLSFILQKHSNDDSVNDSLF